MNRTTLLALFVTMAMLSCKYSYNRITDAKKINDTLNCWSSFDTILKNGDYIKYIKIDTTVDIQVKINDKVTYLGWNLECSMPDGLVPTIYSHKDNLILLIRGFSNTYREVIVCEYISDSIYINRFETELSFEGDSDKSDKVVYKLMADNSKLYISDRLPDNNNDYKTKIITLPKRFVTQTIDKAEVSNNNITLNFTDKTNLSLQINKIE